MIVELTVTINVEFCDEGLGPAAADDPLAQRIKDSVAEAVQMVLDARVADGFAHDMEAVLSLTDVKVAATKLTP